MPEPSASNFPTSLDSDVTLGADVVNIKSFVLSGNISDSATTITTTGTITGQGDPVYIRIDDEIIFVPDGGISGSSFGSCIRGADGTTAAAHKSGARIDVVYSANYFNQLKRAIIAVETELGTDPAGASATVDARLDAIETTSATTTTLGVIELATSAEVLTGTDTTRAVVPDILNDVLTRIPIQGGLINGYISRTVASKI